MSDDLEFSSEETSINTRHISVAFAVSVTEPCSQNTYIAKNGSESIFSLFSNLLPTVSNPICYSIPLTGMSMSCPMMSGGTQISMLDGRVPRRTKNSRRIGRVEFNRLLESSCGFRSIRFRRRRVSRFDHKFQILIMN